MHPVRLVRALGPIDGKSVRRDSLLRWVLFYPVVIALVVRFIVPLLAAHLQQRYQFDLAPYYGLIMSFMVMLSPVLVGVVVGFLLLDQKDDDTLTALQVTPLTLGNYLAYRITVPTLLSVVMTMIIFPLAALVKLGLLPLFLCAVCSAPLAPMLALFCGSFARNKVEGFALMKASGAAIYPPLFAYFVPLPWQLLAGIMPTYWPLRLVWSLLASDPWWWVYFVMGIVTQAAVVALLLRRFNRVMHRR